MSNLNPANTTLVDGKAVQGKVMLAHGQIISIGPRHFRYESLVASEDDVTVDDDVTIAAQARRRRRRRSASVARSERRR